MGNETTPEYGNIVRFDVDEYKNRFTIIGYFLEMDSEKIRISNLNFDGKNVNRSRPRQSEFCLENTGGLAVLNRNRMIIKPKIGQMLELDYFDKVTREKFSTAGYFAGRMTLNGSEAYRISNLQPPDREQLTEDGWQEWAKFMVGRLFSIRVRKVYSLQRLLKA